MNKSRARPSLVLKLAFIDFYFTLFMLNFTAVLFKELHSQISIFYKYVTLLITTIWIIKVIVLISSIINLYNNLIAELTDGDSRPNSTSHLSKYHVDIHSWSLPLNKYKETRNLNSNTF